MQNINNILLDHPVNPSFKTVFQTISSKPVSLDMVIGQTKDHKPYTLDLTQCPHLLIAGQTGAGKSVCINSIISSLILNKTPEEMRLILIDPKVVELSGYNELPHLLTDVITETEGAIKILDYLVEEMESRYKILAQHKVRNLASYNSKNPFNKLPYIVTVIDEFGDLMYTAKKSNFENNMIRIAQKARAVGIHLILATQRPSVNVITGILKANIPTRISFKLPSQIDSRTVLDVMGAESLKGKGDCLVKFNGEEMINIQGSWLSDGQIEIIVNEVYCEYSLSDADFERI